MATYVTKGGIVFNVEDPDQKEMLEHVKKRSNLSGYIKRLIWADMKGKNQKVVQMSLYNEEKDLEPSFDESLMKGMI